MCISSSFNAHSTVLWPTSCVKHTERSWPACSLSRMLVSPLNIFSHHWTFCTCITCSSLYTTHNLQWISAPDLFSAVKNLIILLNSQSESGIFVKCKLLWCLFWLKYLHWCTTCFTNSWKSTEYILIGFSLSELPKCEKKNARCYDIPSRITKFFQKQGKFYLKSSSILLITKISWKFFQQFWSFPEMFLEISLKTTISLYFYKLYKFIKIC